MSKYFMSGWTCFLMRPTCTHDAVLDLDAVCPTAARHTTTTAVSVRVKQPYFDAPFLTSSALLLLALWVRASLRLRSISVPSLLCLIETVVLLSPSLSLSLSAEAQCAHSASRARLQRHLCSLHYPANVCACTAPPLHRTGRLLHLHDRSISSASACPPLRFRCRSSLR